MYIVMIGLLSAIVMSITIQSASIARADRPEGMVSAQHQLNLYRAFAYAADQYVKANPYDATGLRTVDWPALVAAPSTPPGLRGLDMPESWMVRQTSSRWAICAPLDEATISMLQQLLPNNLRRVQGPSALISGLSDDDGTLAERMPDGVSMPSTESLQKMVVTSEPDPSEGVIYAALCQ